MPCCSIAVQVCHHLRKARCWAAPALFTAQAGPTTSASLGHAPYPAGLLSRVPKIKTAAKYNGFCIAKFQFFTELGTCSVQRLGFAW